MGSSDDPDYIGGGTVGSSHLSGSRQSRNRSHETIGRRHDTLYRDRHGHPNAALDVMS